MSCKWPLTIFTLQHLITNYILSIVDRCIKCIFVIDIYYIYISIDCAIITAVHYEY